MGLVKTEGVAIRRAKYGDNGLILTVLTPDMGVVTASARGARNLKSKLGAGVGLFSYSELLLFESGGRTAVRSSVLKESFYSLSANIERLAYATYICDLTGYVAQEGSPPGEIFPLLLNTLYLLANSDKNLRLVKAVFELRLLCAAGFAPSLSACASCGEELGTDGGSDTVPAGAGAFRTEDGAVRRDGRNGRADGKTGLSFSARAGGLLCGDCRAEDPGARPVGGTCLAAMRHIAGSDGKRAFSFVLPEAALSELEGHIAAMMAEYIGKEFYSLAYLNRIIGK